MKNSCILILLIFVLVTGCNENFWGYNYEAPPLVKLTRIQGNLSDKFSGKPIHPATVTINGQETKTDENGNYLLNYIIPDEIEQNEQEIGYLNIIAPDYLHYTSSFIILPVENTVNIELEYSVPTVINAVSHVDTTQAIVRDYQGTIDIVYVSVTFQRFNTEIGDWERKEYEMSKISNINEISAYYQYIKKGISLNNSILSDWFRITAVDNDDNTHQLDFTISPDSSLFF